jgi:hypothetical protein
MFTTVLLPNWFERPAAAATTALRKPAGAFAVLEPQDRLNCRPFAAPTTVVVESCLSVKEEICATDRLLA